MMRQHKRRRLGTTASGIIRRRASARNEVRSNDFVRIRLKVAAASKCITMAGNSEYFGLSGVYCSLAEACYKQNKLDEALEAARRALELGQRIENRDYIGLAWRMLGLIMADSSHSIIINNKPYDPEKCFAESLKIFTDIGAEVDRARTLREWARYEIKRGNRQRGHVMWQEAIEIFLQLDMQLEVEQNLPVI